MATDGKFSQMAAVTRCRNITETKLKAQQALAKLADEEVTIHSANLEDSLHQFRTQIIEQTAVETRQNAAAENATISWGRKEQLNKLIDKLTSIKSMLRFQEEARQREIDFKNSIRQMRAAFQVRLARLEQRQSAERNELQLSQNRLADTVTQIRMIEMKSLKDRNQVRRLKREFEIQAQQASMRQQKEFEFLREIQLCKAKQMAEVNDLDINNQEEIEDIITQQRRDEFELIAKHQAIEADMATALGFEKCKLEASQLMEKQKIHKASLQRSQRKQANSIAKVQRIAARVREKSLIADYPVIKGDMANGNAADDDTENQSESVSEGTTRSDGSNLSLHEKTVNPVTGQVEEDEGAKEKTETEKNSLLNKDTKVLSESEKEMLTLMDSGNERNRGIVMHHKKIITELKQLHRFVLSQKAKEHRRKTAELLKDHEEEIEQIKVEQASIMKELMETHLQSEEMRADTALSQNLLGMMLPAHIMEKIELGVVPEPESFNCVSLFFTDIFEFKKLVASVSPVQILKLLNLLYTRFDAVIAKYSQLYKVESVADTYMVAAGLSSNVKSKEDIAECTIQALNCCIELQGLVKSMDFSEIVGQHAVKLRIGIHSGTINAGLIGTKMSRYCLFGDTVNTASRMCTTGDASKIQVSPQTILVLGEDDQFEFEIRGEIEVKGKGMMRTYWLIH
ncbi:Nitrogen permease reactivator protein [Chytriomyces hyalinus]|nr:Nitrogen permease reactivator protein [Chytriomyces hyalinus]